MLATGSAETRPTTTGTAAETRPVRLLVPTRRDSDYWLPYNDTLRAADLGVTRQTTDDRLAELVNDAAAALAAADLHEDPVAYLRRIRDALRHPRDIAEAREWGFIIPQGENREELSTDPRAKSLGWWWVLDPVRVETRDEREARYRADRRLIDMSGFARVVLRSYHTVKEDKSEADAIYRVLDNPQHLHKQAATIIKYESSLTIEQATERLLAKAREDALDAVPRRRNRAGQSAQWYVWDALDFGRDTRRLNEWYEYSRRSSPGRPKGARTRNRRATAAR